MSGTSFAAPHVAGALALLLSALPQGIPLDYQRSALVNSAKDLGIAGPDNDTGYGRLDVLAAYQWLINNPYPHPDQLDFIIPYNRGKRWFAVIDAGS